MKRQKIIILPQLHDYQGDVAKQWFVYFSFRNPATGKMIRFREYKGFAGLNIKERYAHADSVIKDLSQKLKNGWNPFEADNKVVYSDTLEYRQTAASYGRMRETVKDIRYYSSTFLDWKMPRVRPATFTTYKSKMRYLCEFCEQKKIAGAHPAVFTADHARMFNQYLPGRGIGSRSINEYNTLMRQFWNYLVDQEVVKENPFEKIKRLKFSGNKPRIYNNVMMSVLKAIMERMDPQLLIAVRLIFNCLIRPGELRKLKIKDIDFVRSQITIPGPVAKTGKQRTVDVPDYVLSDMVAKGYGKASAKHYIITTSGKPGLRGVGRNYLYNHFRRVRNEAGIGQEYWLYAFKHTGMVEMKLAGVDWLDIRNQAGHQSLDQTIEYTQELMGVGSAKIRHGAPRM